MLGPPLQAHIRLSRNLKLLSLHAWASYITQWEFLIEWSPPSRSTFQKRFSPRKVVLIASNSSRYHRRVTCGCSSNLDLDHVCTCCVHCMHLMWRSKLWRWKLRETISSIELCAITAPEWKRRHWTTCFRSSVWENCFSFRKISSTVFQRL